MTRCIIKKQPFYRTVIDLFDKWGPRRGQRAGCRSRTALLQQMRIAGVLQVRPQGAAVALPRAASRVLHRLQRRAPCGQSAAGAAGQRRGSLGATQPVSPT